jgi:serine/threonine-protein kinase
MATVYTAHARSLNTTVGIKVLAPRFARDPALLARFRAEAQNIANLHHPNIVEVYYCGEEDGVAFIAMRYVPGGTLKDLVESLGGPMDLRTAARITSQVAAALQHAHEHGMVHLDVKPGNVLLGKADWPLLSDFGITKIAGNTEDGHRVAGTPAYMSPEQWQGGEVDGRSDEYSLGLMFYELVTGRRPFTGETSAELKAQHMHEEPPRPRQINPGIPGPVEEVMLRALAKNPDDRFPTVDEFGQALVEAVERSRGMQLETKQQIVSAVPNVLALIVLSLLAPLLESLPNPELPIVGELTLNWPIALVVAILQTALLLGIRWQIIGLATRLVGAGVDALDRFTRVYVRLGTDAEGPLHVARWRNAAISTAEGLVNVFYLFVVYQIAAVPLAKTIALPVQPGLEDLVATAITAVVLLFSAAIVVRIWRATGPVVAVCVLAVCWAFLSAVRLVDVQVAGGVSVQWLAKLVVGIGVLAAFLAIRKRTQRGLREYVVPVSMRQLRGLRRGLGSEEQAAYQRQIELGVDGIVNLIFLVIGYAIIAFPLSEVLTELAGATVSAVVITAGVLVIAALLVMALRNTSGVVAASIGLVICTPTLLGLPLFSEDLGSTSLQWAARVVIGLGVLLLFLSVRRRIQSAGRPIIVPFVAHQLGSFRPAASEEEEEKRIQTVGRTSDAVVDLLYLLVGYFAVVGPATSALAQIEGLAQVGTAIYVLFVVTILYVLYQLGRDVVPALRPPPSAPPVAPATSS